MKLVTKMIAAAMGIALLMPGQPVLAAKPKPAQEAATFGQIPADLIVEPAQVGPNMQLTIGKSTLLRMPAPVDRISVGSPDIADVTLISSRELYLLGKSIGTTNLILWSKTRGATVIDIAVNFDIEYLQNQFRRLMPSEPGIKAEMAAEFIVLIGEVSSALAVNDATQIAQAYINRSNRGLVLQTPIESGTQQVTNISTTRENPKGARDVAGNFVINRLKVTSPQQVMLEVKVAEVNKTLLDKLGAQFNISRTNGDWTYSIISSFLSDAGGVLDATKSFPDKLIRIDAEKQDGLVKILAEPNLMAISGQEASFNAGGKIFIPVARSDNLTGFATITLEEKEFGVGLKFTPTVLEGGRIHLKVAPRVSELSQTGSPFTTIGNVTAILPTFTERRAETSIQLNDGQSFAIAGLIKNNVTETVKRFPVLGEVPIFGALFRSSEFQTDRSELLFIVTPRLVKPLPPNYALPTDNFTPPDRVEFFLEGKMEGRPGSRSDQASSPKPAGPGGFEVK